MWVKLERVRCLVVGAGSIGYQKIQSLTEYKASVTVIARQAVEEVIRLGRDKKIKLLLRDYRTGDCRPFELIVVATNDSVLNKKISKEARRFKRWVNVVDVPGLCSFYYGSIARMGDLQISVSTNGQSPALAAKIKSRLEKQYSAYVPLLNYLGGIRKRVKQKFGSDTKERDAFFRRILEEESLNVEYLRKKFPL